MKPHKHAELIKAWADGHTIQMQSKIDGRWWDQEDPEWDKDYEYRIKPETTFTSSKFDLNLRFTVQTNGGLHKIVGVELRDE
jgi:hypothetical protein